MKIVSVFNNKGGVGKSTLSYHVAYALSELGVKTLMIDLDPQSNLSLQCVSSEELEQIWNAEEDYIEDFQAAMENHGGTIEAFYEKPRTIHAILKPIEDGVYEKFVFGKVIEVNKNLGLIPGRLSLHKFEDKLAKSWSEAFMGDPQALRLISSIRNICKEANEKHGYEFVIIDTSPSLGILNRVIISMSTGFFVPCMPDMFSSFGIKNIGGALRVWKQQFDTMTSLLSPKKRNELPDNFVKFLGYTIYNAKKYKDTRRKTDKKFNLATAHYNYAIKLPDLIDKNIPKGCYPDNGVNVLEHMGGEEIMYTHNTLPSMAQKYKLPMWLVPDHGDLDKGDISTISGNSQTYKDKQAVYHEFAKDLIARLEGMED